MPTEALLLSFTVISFILIAAYKILFKRPAQNERKEPTIKSTNQKYNPTNGIDRTPSYSSILNIYLFDEIASLVNITPTHEHPENWRAQVFINNQGGKLEEFTSNNIKIPEISKIHICQGISKNIFHLIIAAIHTTHEAHRKNIARLHSAYGIKNGEIKNLTSYTENSGTEIILNAIFDQVKKSEIDYGIFFYFEDHKHPLGSGMHIEIIHNLFSAIYFIPFKCRHDENGLLVMVQTENLVRLLVGDVVGKRNLMSFTYRDANGKQTNRDILGGRMHIENGREYIRGFCLLRYEERNFRRDRIIKFRYEN